MEIRAIALAAGRGDRLRPLTDTVPKAAMPVLDVPVGAWAVAALQEVTGPVLVNASWLAPEVAGALGGPDVEIFTELPDAYGTGGTLKALEPRLGTQVLIHNCDLVTDLRPEDLLASHESSGTAGTIAVVQVPSGADVAHEHGRATRFVDRRSEDLPGAIYIGMAVLERSAIGLLPSRRPLGLGETLLKDLAGAGDLAVHVHEGYRIDVGDPASYLRASIDVLERRAPAPPRRPPGEIVEVEGGRAYVGPGATVAEGTLGPNAIVLADARVEPDAHVEDAIVWRGVQIDSGRRVAGAIALADEDLQV